MQYNYEHLKNLKKQKTKPDIQAIIVITKDNTAIAITTYYGIYIILSLYIIVEIKFHSAGRPENYSIEVWKYIYMSNNGYFIFFIFTTPILKEAKIYGCLSLSFFICLGGTIYYVCKILKITFKGFTETYFSCSGLLSWFYLPCIYVWPFIGLTDPCCMHSLYTMPNVGYGNIRYFGLVWNYFIWLIKRFSFLLSTILYYWFLIYLSIAWAIIKLILFFILKYKKQRPVVIVQNSQNIIGMNNLNNNNNVQPSNNIQIIEPTQINVLNNVNILKLNVNKGDNKNIGEQNVLKMESQNYNNSQNSISSEQLMNNNKSRNIYFEIANRRAEEDIYKTPVTTPAYDARISCYNKDIHDGNPAVQTKTDRGFKSINNFSNDNIQAAPPFIIQSMKENELPNESSIYN